jgi:hypothetical protein
MDLFVSPRVGFEPTANRLTADRSTAELSRMPGDADVAKLVDAPDLGSGKLTCESSSLSVRNKF